MRSLITRRRVLAGLLVVGLAATGFAADAARCPASTQDCLNFMASNLAERGWVGIETDDSGGITEIVVERVVKESPADKAGFKRGDTLVAVNGVPFADANRKKIKNIQSSMTAGDDFTYTVLRRGSRKDLHGTLAPMPDDVKAQIIGEHMLEHAEFKVATAQKD